MPSAGGSPSPFPNTMPCCSPPSLFTLCTRFVVALGPTSRSIAVVFVVHRGRFATLSPAVSSPVRAPRTLRRWATVGRSSPSVCVKVAILSGPLVAACVSPPLILRTRRMKRSGGGDIHRSSPQPSFSCRGRGSTRAPPRHPGSASERKESMTEWWLVANSILKRGGKCRHHGDGV